MTLARPRSDALGAESRTRTSKDTVRRYFDNDVTGYLDAYERETPGDARHDTFQARRDLVLEMTPPSARRVLDIGAGPGVMTERLLARGASCWVVDLSFEMVASAALRHSRDERRAHFTVADIDGLPFADASFDASLCVGVLQYLPSLEFALLELARVTAPGGHVIVTFPNVRSPLNRLHRAAIACARRARAFGLGERPDPARLTFRSDIPNNYFSVSEIEQHATRAGLVTDRVAYHVLQFPFVIPGLGAVVRAWNQWAHDRAPSGIWAGWGREGVVRFKRA